MRVSSAIRGRFVAARVKSRALRRRLMIVERFFFAKGRLRQRLYDLCHGFHCFLEILIFSMFCLTFLFAKRRLRQRIDDICL